MSWQYKVEEVKLKAKGFWRPDLDPKQLEALLNDWDRKGWEVVSVDLSRYGANGMVISGGKANLVLRRPR